MTVYSYTVLATANIYIVAEQLVASRSAQTRDTEVWSAAEVK